MGGNTSQLLPPPANFPYFSLTFRKFDIIKLIDCDQQCLIHIQKVAQTDSPSGILSQFYDHSGAYEIMFRGNPFSRKNGKTEALAIKRMCCSLLIALHSIGWELCVSSNLSRTTDLTTWFFQKNLALNGRRKTADEEIICLSLTSHDKLELVNAPSYLHKELLQCVGPLLENHEVYGRDFEVKMIGCPWSSADIEEGTTARQLLLNIIRKFDSFNYRFHGTANLTANSMCIFFENDSNYPGGRTRFCMLSLNSTDRIRLIDCPQEVVDTVGRCIIQYWPGGIQDFCRDKHCVEYHLKGLPWYSNGEDAINSRFLITLILQSLVTVGWEVMSALDVSRRVDDKAVFVLRSCAPASIAHICISPSDTDLIRLINAPKDVRNAVSGVIHSNWPKGIRMEGERLMAYEWKLAGCPWSSHGDNDFAMSRQLMTRVLNEMARLGWRVISSADVSATYIPQQNCPVHNRSGHDNPEDVYCWFLARTSHVVQLPEAAGTSSTIGFRMSSAPYPTSSEAISPPPSYEEVMNEKY